MNFECVCFSQYKYKVEDIIFFTYNDVTFSFPSLVEPFKIWSREYILSAKITYESMLFHCITKESFTCICIFLSLIVPAFRKSRGH